MALQENSLIRYWSQEHLKQNLSQTICHVMCQQDHLGRTALHLAIIYEQKKTLQVYQDVVKEIITTNYRSRVQQRAIDKFRKLFKIYDHQGNTVLHSAVQFNLLQFVKVGLKFCKKFHIKIEKMETLGSGDNILHLAVRQNYVEMVKVIIKLQPVLLSVKNYAGNLALNEPDMPLEMKMFIKRSLKPRTNRKES